ncbi:MAG: peptide deformylase [Desulfovibrio sp.]|jgi:peptide deformylase|nr:peptide deformylase [Desulfovibrio sp.]
MKLDIVAYPDPRLTRTCEAVAAVNDEIRTLVADMFETMYALRGVGLAAPQVGRPLRLLVMDTAMQDEAPSPRVVINPQLELFGREIVSEREGCLSIPLEFRADVVRREEARLAATDLAGNSFELELSGFPAIVAQHEFDHLNGVLFIDHISRLRRTLYDKRLKKWLNRSNTA